MKHIGFMLLVLALLTAGTLAQDDPYDSQPTHKREKAFTFSLATSGLSLGGMYRFPMKNFTHIGVNFEFFMLRDDKEFSYIDPYTGYGYSFNNINRFFTIPLNVELKKRLFTNTIEDDFRPHLMLQAGVIFGMNFPKEDALTLGDEAPSNIPRDDEYQVTYNVVIGAGVDVKTSKNNYLGLRPQYRFVYFPSPIAGEKNHSAFEIKFEIGARN